MHMFEAGCFAVSGSKRRLLDSRNTLPRNLEVIEITCKVCSYLCLSVSKSQLVSNLYSCRISSELALASNIVEKMKPTR